VYGFPSLGVETDVVGMEICKAGDIVGSMRNSSDLVRDREEGEDAHG
jgi:hypothetical protein